MTIYYFLTWVTNVNFGSKCLKSSSVERFEELVQFVVNLLFRFSNWFYL
jgi:hypothetical protein